MHVKYASCNMYWIIKKNILEINFLLIIQKLSRKVLWHTDPLLVKDIETNNETTAVAMQQRRKHASTTIDLLL
jgi:hypothetical protein